MALHNAKVMLYSCLRTAAYGRGTAKRPERDWVVPLDGIMEAPLAKLAAKLGGVIPPAAPAGQGSNVQPPKPRKRVRAPVGIDSKVSMALATAYMLQFAQQLIAFKMRWQQHTMLDHASYHRHLYVTSSGVGLHLGTER